MLSGYYHDEIHLTYRIYDKDNGLWDLILTVDYETKKINRVFMHRQYPGMTEHLLEAFMAIVDKIFEVFYKKEQLENVIGKHVE